jgi:hypothetical protein
MRSITLPERVKTRALQVRTDSPLLKAWKPFLDRLNLVLDNVDDDIKNDFIIIMPEFHFYLKHFFDQWVTEWRDDVYEQISDYVSSNSHYGWYDVDLEEKLWHGDYSDAEELIAPFLETKRQYTSMHKYCHAFLKDYMCNSLEMQYDQTNFIHTLLERMAFERGRRTVYVSQNFVMRFMYAVQRYRKNAITSKSIHWWVRQMQAICWIWHCDEASTSEKLEPIDDDHAEMHQQNHDDAVSFVKSEFNHAEIDIIGRCARVLRTFEKICPSDTFSRDEVRLFMKDRQLDCFNMLNKMWLDNEILQQKVSPPMQQADAVTRALFVLFALSLDCSYITNETDNRSRFKVTPIAKPGWCLHDLERTRDCLKSYILKEDHDHGTVSVQ